MSGFGTSRSTTRGPAVWRWWAVICMLAGMVLMAVSPAAGQSDAPRVRVLSIDGTITPPMAQYIEGGIRNAGMTGSTRS